MASADPMGRGQFDDERSRSNRRKVAGWMLRSVRSLADSLLGFPLYVCNISP